MGTKYTIRENEGIYFLTLTIVDWLDVFTRTIYCDFIVENLNFCIKQKGLRIHAYVIMTNHIHLVASVEDESVNKLDHILRDFKKFTAKKLYSII